VDTVLELLGELVGLAILVAIWPRINRIMLGFSRHLTVGRLIVLWALTIAVMWFVLDDAFTTGGATFQAIEFLLLFAMPLGAMVLTIAFRDRVRQARHPNWPVSEPD
jgi:hypothetical protein